MYSESDVYFATVLTGMYFLSMSFGYVTEPWFAGGAAGQVTGTRQWRVQMGARGAHAIPSRLKKGAEKDVDLRPRTYVRTRGAKYRC